VRTAGGAANANTTYSLTTGGGSCTCTPATTDVVVLDSNSGTYTINTNTSIGVLDATGTVSGASGSPFAGTVSISSNTSLTINNGVANAFKLVPGMTLTLGNNQSTVIFANTSLTAGVTTAGKNLANVAMNGVGGTAQQLDDINMTVQPSSGLTITNGIWDANGHTITAGVFSGTGATARGFILGGLVKLGVNIIAGATVWTTGTTTNLTFTKNSADIEIVSQPSSLLPGISFQGGGLTFNNLTFDNNATPTAVTFGGSNTFANLTVGSGWNILHVANTTNTIANLAVNGTAQAWSGWQANGTTAGQTPALSISGSCTMTVTVISSVTASGAGTPCAVTNGLNLAGTVTGFSFTGTPGGGGGGGGSGIIGGF
jgi:hypothetical protein